MTWTDLVAALPAVSLEALNEEAALQTRVDRKYVVDAQTWAHVLTEHAASLQALDVSGSRAAQYRSLYYDTPEMASYLAAARKRPRRFKVRVREYVDSGTSAVEVKLRSARGATVKHRQFVEGTPSVDEVVAFAASFPLVAPYASELAASLETTYTRTTLLHPQGRITIDAGVTAVDASASERDSMDYGELLIVETKCTGAAGDIDRALWSRGIRPVRLSKYATSLAALHPNLPANRWHRTLSRHVAAA